VRTSSRPVLEASGAFRLVSLFFWPCGLRRLVEPGWEGNQQARIARSYLRYCRVDTAVGIPGLDRLTERQQHSLLGSNGRGRGGFEM
jgi:hypothetical protein